MADLGRAALVVSFGLALYALVGGTAAAITRQRRLAESARYALIACFGSTVIASAVLIRALVEHDFTYAYVRQHTSRDLKTIYCITAFWGGEEGSLLLWLLVLTGYGALAVILNRKLLRDIVVWVVPVIGGFATFFSFMLVAVASPFVTEPRVVDGAGLVPSLQNIYMVAHPPMLYLGYVGMTIPFAFAAGALLSGQTDERWIIATRRWTLTAWMFLGFGLLLGAHWAYIEVGWGGFYGWDPVENAALMPWLAATAFLHSVMIQERKGMLRIWNMVLIALAYELTLFGTFLNRSGVVESIHSFAKSSIGGWFLAFVIVTTLFSLTLILWRLPLLRARTKLESPLSREATFLYNNLLLVALCLTVFWGEIFPILAQMYQGVSRTLGQGYYDFFLRIFGLPLLLLMGDRPADRLAALLGEVAPEDAALADRHLARGGGSARRPRRRLLAPRPDRLHLLRLRPLHDRRRVRPGDARDRLALPARLAQPSPLRRLHRPRLDRAAGARDHRIGCIRDDEGGPARPRPVDAHARLHADERGADPDAKPDRVRHDRRHARSPARAWPLERHDDLDLRQLVRARPLPRRRDPHELAPRRGPLRDPRPGRRQAGVRVKVLVKPLVNLLWVGGYLFVFGSLVAMWPDAREQRRLVTRLSLARA